MNQLESLAEHFVIRWPNAALLALGLVALSLALHWLGVVALSRLVRGHTLSERIAREARSPMLLVLPLLLLQLLWHAADDQLGAINALRHVNLVLLIAALTWLALRLLRGAAAGVVDLHPVAGDDDLHARGINTQARVLSRIVSGLVVVVGFALVIMTFPGVSQLGGSLLASAGVAGLIAGLAARPAISNLIAGLQIAIAQPIRIDDVLIVQGEWGRVEEITGTYVVLRVWDERRLVIPLQWFIENPFQNWTRHSAQLTGMLYVWVDYAAPLDALRAEALRLCEASDEWDRRLCTLEVTDANDRAIQLRVLVTSANADRVWALRCKVREGLVRYLQRDYPQHLPRQRTEIIAGSAVAVTSG